MTFTIDINSDIGEGFGAYRFGNDVAILQHISSANIACGLHAGDPKVMYQTVETAIKHGVAIGAHPGFPDLLGFGRRNMDVPPLEIYQLMIYQLGALQGFTQVFGTRIQHVKPHGALYNMAAKDRKIADAIAQAVYDFDNRLILFGLAGSELIRAAQQLGLRVAREAFADRTYQADGNLTPRSQENAIIKDVDAAVQRVIKMVTTGRVDIVDGQEIELQVDTICVHGDEADAPLFAQQLKEKLTEHGIKVERVGSNG